MQRAPRHWSRFMPKKERAKQDDLPPTPDEIERVKEALAFIEQAGRDVEFTQTFIRDYIQAKVIYIN